MKELPMLPYALHPDTLHPVTIDAYCRQFDGLSLASRPSARCPICNQEVEVARAHDRAQTRYFKHPLRTLSPCPIVSSSMPDTLAQVSLDAAPARELVVRQAFIDKWVWHFQRARELAPACNVERFTRAIAHADVLHLWASAALVQSDIPYVLLALTGFMIAAPDTPRIWLRFWFDRSVQTFEDLHTPRSTPARLYRLRYRNVQTGRFPEARHLTDWSEIAMRTDFLTAEQPRLTSADLQTFQTFLSQRSAPDQDEAFALEQ